MMTEYIGEVFGFRYEITKANDAEFRAWLKAKLERYMLDANVSQVLKEILGVDALETRVMELEKKVG